MPPRARGTFRRRRAAPAGPLLHRRTGRQLPPARRAADATPRPPESPKLHTRRRRAGPTTPRSSRDAPPASAPAKTKPCLGPPPCCSPGRSDERCLLSGHSGAGCPLVVVSGRWGHLSDDRHDLQDRIGQFAVAVYGDASLGVGGPYPAGAQPPEARWRLVPGPRQESPATQVRNQRPAPLPARSSTVCLRRRRQRPRC